MKNIPWSKSKNWEKDTQAVPEVDIIFGGGIVPQQKKPQE